ncbi:chitin synthase-domain-containing protein [Aspergillus varians]
MSLPQRPGKASPRREETSAFREPSRRRRRGSETSGNDDSTTSPRHHRHHRSHSSRHHQDVDEERGEDTGVRRKKSLVKPERNRIDSSHPNYLYHQRTQNMPTYNSMTGTEPLIHEDGEGETTSTPSMDSRRKDALYGAQGNVNKPMERVPSRHRSKKRRKISKREAAAEKRRQRAMEQVRPPSLWTTYCSVITFWSPDFIMKCFGMPQKAQRSAWREKMGLISIILLIAAFVGFLTFGFTATVCGAPPTRMKINELPAGYMIFHGQAYDLVKSTHPAAAGIEEDYNIAWTYGSQDGSFFFQKVNGDCKGLITLAEGSDVPTNSDGDLAWYFPCAAFNQDGSSDPNMTTYYYPGWACHTSRVGRQAFYKLSSAGDVYFTWEDTKNTSRNLAVYSGNVLDLDLLSWFNTSQVKYPAKFDALRENPEIRGVDLTYYFQTGEDKQLGKCLSQIIKVGSIDTDTVGCIASQVVLYVSLIFILSIVIVKFAFALFFQWFLARRFAAQTTTMGTVDSRARNQQIEDWSNDIYRPGPRIMDHTPADRMSKRASFLPTTSRFSSPYTVSNGGKQKPQWVTMASQNSTTRLVPSNTTPSVYRQSQNGSGNLSVDNRLNPSASRTSLVQDSYYSTAIPDSDGLGSAGYIHELVVPQPPPDWQPYGYPLAHSMCLVTCYSEGEDGIRTTLDSVALTDYPNSHKSIIVICDGMIKGKGEEFSTPEIVLRMMKDPIKPPEEVEAFSYVAVATGSKRHNMAQIHAGFYDYGENSMVPPEKQQRVPMMIIVKCGTPAESTQAKPGNRGKRDSQIILMSFLQKVMFDERMTELEYEMFNGLLHVTGIPPDFYEVVLMVDADTKVFPDSLTHMISAMVKDPEVMGLCGETKIANKTDSWVTMIQVFEYFVSHHQSKAFESVFGGVTCLPGCFSMYRIKAPKGGQNYWVPILANPDVVEHYSENVVDTLHKKNLLLLGEDRYLSTLMLRTFPKRKQIFVPQAVCKTVVPDKFMILLSQRRRWINSTVHNLMELVLVRDLCGTFCFSMQFVIFIELIGTLVLPAAISFTVYVVVSSIINRPVQVIPLVLLALILGLPGVLVVVTAHRLVYVLWMFVYLLSLPVWNFVLPTYAYWKFDDFSWGDTRKTAGEKDKGHADGEGEFDSSKITMKRWRDFEKGMSIDEESRHDMSADYI